MLYLKASDYRIDIIYDRGLYILGKHFIQNEFLPNNLELARRKCREYLEANLVCILVEFSDRFGIYYLNYDWQIIDNSIPSRKVDLNLAENNRKKFAVSLEKLFKNNNLETFADFSELVKKIGLNLAINLNTKSELRFYSLLPQKLILDREIALKVLYKSLNYCRLIAELIYRDAIEEVDKIEKFADLTELFNRLADEIEDIKYREQFQAIVTKNIVYDRDLALKIIKYCLKKTAGLVAE